jgi:hypothetical protein
MSQVTLAVIRGAKDLHLTQPNSRPGTHPCPWEIHPFELVRRQEDVRLSMGNRNHVFPVTLDVIRLKVFPCALVEQVL